MKFGAFFRFVDPKASEKSGVCQEPNKKLKKSKRRHVILRVLNSLFSIVVFGCIIQQGFSEGKCLYNASHACDYGITVGIIAFVSCVLFTLADAVTDHDRQKCLTIIDGSFSVVCAMLYFFGFMYLGNQWMKSETPWNDYGVNNMRAAIVFCAISVFSWTAQAYYTFREVAVFTPATYETSPDNSSTLPPHYFAYTYGNNYEDKDGATYPGSYVYESDKGFIYDQAKEGPDPPPPYVSDIPPPTYANVCGTTDQGFI